MQVYLVRHAAAVEPHEAPSDEARWLTIKGRHRMREVTAFLGADGVALDVIFTSPLVRAVQTAEILSGLTGFEGDVRVWSALAPESSTVVEALSVLDTLDPTARVALVGHEPSIRQFAGHLVGVRRFPAFEKGAVCAVRRTATGAGSFEWMLLPKTLQKIEGLDDVLPT